MPVHLISILPKVKKEIKIMIMIVIMVMIKNDRWQSLCL